MLRLKPIDRAILVTNRLHHNGYLDKRAACLLGIYDGQVGRMGAWKLNRNVALIMRVLRRALLPNYAHHPGSRDA
jgi:hypothetical protein